MLRNGDEAENKGMSTLKLEVNVNKITTCWYRNNLRGTHRFYEFWLQNLSDLPTFVADETRTAFLCESDMTSAAVHESRYPSAVIEEGLRLAPPVPERLVRPIPPDGQKNLLDVNSLKAYVISLFPHPPFPRAHK